MKRFEFENYLGKEDFIFVEADKLCNDLAVLLCNKLIDERVRLYYDSNNKNDEHLKEEVAPRIKDAKKVIFIMNKDTSNNLEFRNMVNYALEIKKDVVIIKDSDYKLTHGMDMQLANVPTFIFDEKTIDEKLNEYEIITQDVIGELPNKKNINKKKQYIFIGLICFIVALLAVGVITVKNRLEYYNSFTYIYKDVENIDCIDISNYGNKAFEELQEKTINELDMSNGGFDSVDGINKLNVKTLNIAHNPNITNINLVFYCKGLERIKCSQDMLDNIMKYASKDVIIEVVN